MNLYCQLVPCASRCHQMLLFCTPYVCYHFINIYNNILEKCPLKKIGIIHPVNKATSLSQKRISYEDSNFTSPLFLDHVINPKSRVVLSSTVATTHMWLMSIWNVSEFLIHGNCEIRSVYCFGLLSRWQFVHCHRRLIYKVMSNILQDLSIYMEIIYPYPFIYITNYLCTHAHTTHA